MRFFDGEPSKKCIKSLSPSLFRLRAVLLMSGGQGDFGALAPRNLPVICSPPRFFGEGPGVGLFNSIIKLEN